MAQRRIGEKERTMTREEIAKFTEGKAPEQALSEFTNGVPLPLCLYLSAREAEKKGMRTIAQRMDILSDLSDREEYANTEGWLRKHKHCACGRPLYRGSKKPELEFSITVTGFEVRLMCGPCALNRDLITSPIIDALLSAIMDDQNQPGDGPDVTVALKDILPGEDYSAVERFFNSARLCDECGEPIDTKGERQHMFSSGPEGITRYFICGRCTERWKSEAILPNILAKMMAELCSPLQCFILLLVATGDDGSSNNTGGAQ
jgi:hypothetical protein